MTLIVGILCEDGVVLGADGAATMGSADASTARQPVHKLRCWDNAIAGFSGAVGMAQRLGSQYGDLRTSNAMASKHPTEVMAKIGQGFQSVLGPEYQILRSVPESLMRQAIPGVLCYSIIAMVVKHKPCLFQFDLLGRPEMATQDLPFVAIGCGQPIADPFLAFAKRVFWGNAMPKIEQGILATLWTLEHAIDISPGGVADPVQLCVLKQDGKDFRAHEISEAERQEHHQYIEGMVQKLRDYAANPSHEKDAPTGDMPQPPQHAGGPAAPAPDQTPDP
jgi:20S proteasome alpha/beta subunit